MRFYTALAPYLKLSCYMVLVLTVLALVWLVCQFYYRKYKNFPPGPLPWPVLGNVLQVDSQHMYKTFMDWTQEYGKTFCVKLGFQTALVVHDPRYVRELFSEYAYSGRPQNYFLTLLSGGPNGIVANEGPEWEAQRRFTLRHLRDFGFGKITMDSLIIGEAKEITNWIKREQGHPLPDLHRKLSLALLSVLWTLISGQRYSQEDEKFTAIWDSLQEGAATITKHPFLVVAPWVRHTIPRVSGYKKFREVVNRMVGFLRETIDKRRGIFFEDDDDEPSDFIDSYLREIRETEDPSSSFYEENGETNLQAVVADLFQGGADTTSISLTWAILFLMTHPDVQKKLQKEIDTRIGPTRLPTLYDRLKMPYTEAVILETLRVSSVVPLGIFHSSLSDSCFHDYFIPQGTWIWANLYAIHMDAHVWGDPENFNPDRFLEKDGDSATIYRFHETLAFSTGKRECPGRSLANDIMFIFITSIFQRFTAIPDPDYEVPDILDSDNGFFRAPKKFSVIMRPRASILNTPITITVN